MKSKEVKEFIAFHLKDFFKEEGFIYKKTNNEFVRVNGEFKYIFSIEQLSWPGSISIIVRLYISHKLIEEKLENIIGKLNHKLTMGDEIDRIFFSPDGKKIINGNLSIWIYSNKDMIGAVNKLKYIYYEIAKIYFDKYKSLSDIDYIFNTPPFEYCPADLGLNFENRYVKGLIVACLIKNPNFKFLVEIYDKGILKYKIDESVKRYYLVRDYLLDHCKI